MIRLPLTACRRVARTIRGRRVIHQGTVVRITWTGHHQPSSELDEVELTLPSGVRYEVQGTTEVDLDDDLLEQDWQSARAGLMALVSADKAAAGTGG